VNARSPPELAEILGAFHVPVPFRTEAAKRVACAPEIAGAALGLAAGGGRLHAAVDQFSSSHLEVKRELLVHFVVDAGRHQTRLKKGIGVRD